MTEAEDMMYSLMIKVTAAQVVCCFEVVEEDSTTIVCIELNDEVVDRRTYTIVSTSSLTRNTSFRSDLLTFDHISRQDRWEFALVILILTDVALHLDHQCD